MPSDKPRKFGPLSLAELLNRSRQLKEDAVRLNKHCKELDQQIKEVEDSQLPPKSVAKNGEK